MIAKQLEQIIDKIHHNENCPYIDNELNQIRQMLVCPQLLKEEHIEHIKKRIARVISGDIERVSILPIIE